MACSDLPDSSASIIALLAGSLWLGAAGAKGADDMRFMALQAAVLAEPTGMHHPACLRPGPSAPS